MPQKFNPDVLELVRSKAAEAVGLQTAALTLLHAMPGGYNRDLQDSKPLYMKGLSITRSTLRILEKVVAGLAVDAKACRAAFTPGVFATDVALRKVSDGMPWRDAYHSVRDNLQCLENEDPDDAIAAKRHEGGTAGLDFDGYKKRFACSLKSVKKRLAAFDAKRKALFK
jgi:argininosuccinate lyase